VPKPVAGAFTVVCVARPPERGQAIPEGSQSTRMARSRPGYHRWRDGWLASRMLSGSDLAGSPPLHAAAAPGGWWRDPSVKGGVHEQACRHPPATVAVAAAAWRPAGVGESLA
jgi:hypothetical protein